LNIREVNSLLNFGTSNTRLHSPTIWEHITLPLTLVNFSIWLLSDVKVRLFIDCGGKWQRSEWNTEKVENGEKVKGRERECTDQKRRNWDVCSETWCEGFVSTPELHPSLTLGSCKLTFGFSIFHYLATHVKRVHCLGLTVTPNIQ